MYSRVISFTLLAPSLWSVIESIGKREIKDDHKRYLFKSAKSAGFFS